MEIPASAAVIPTSSAVAPIAGHDGVMVSRIEITSMTTSLVPAHRSWIGEGPGTGRISITGAAAHG